MVCRVAVFIGIISASISEVLSHEVEAVMQAPGLNRVRAKRLE